MGRYYDDNAVLGYIDKYAPMYGVDPGAMKKLFRYEGGNGDIWQSKVPHAGGPNGREDSYGPWQFYMGGGLGNRFQKETGLDPRNPANIEPMTQYAAKVAGQNGWADWYGARDNGMGRWEGISRGAQANASAPIVAPNPADAAASTALGMTPVLGSIAPTAPVAPSADAWSGMRSTPPAAATPTPVTPSAKPKLSQTIGDIASLFGSMSPQAPQIAPAQFSAPSNATPLWQVVAALQPRRRA